MSGWSFLFLSCVLHVYVFGVVGVGACGEPLRVHVSIGYCCIGGRDVVR